MKHHQDEIRPSSCAVTILGVLHLATSNSVLPISLVSMLVGHFANSTSDLMLHGNCHDCHTTFPPGISHGPMQCLPISQPVHTLASKLTAVHSQRNGLAKQVNIFWFTTIVAFNVTSNCTLKGSCRMSGLALHE